MAAPDCMAHVEDDCLVIRIKLDALACATESSPTLEHFDTEANDYRSPIVTDNKVWGREVMRELNREEEDGTTPIHRMLDAVFEDALENGAEGILTYEDREYAAEREKRRLQERDRTNTSDDIGETMRKVEAESQERTFQQFIVRARNMMRAVKIAIEEGNTDEAIQMIDDALGDDPDAGKATASREEALSRLLAPIRWSMTSSIRARQNLVVQHRKEVELVLPFLTPAERIKADRWLKKERHSDLWG